MIARPWPTVDSPAVPGLECLQSPHKLSKKNHKKWLPHSVSHIFTLIWKLDPAPRSIDATVLVILQRKNEPPSHSFPEAALPFRNTRRILCISGGSLWESRVETFEYSAVYFAVVYKALSFDSPRAPSADLWPVASPVEIMPSNTTALQQKGANEKVNCMNMWTLGSPTHIPKYTELKVCKSSVKKNKLSISIWNI